MMKYLVLPMLAVLFFSFFMFLLLAAADLPYLFSIAVAADKVREDDDDRDNDSFDAVESKNIILSKYVVHGVTVW